MTAGYEEWRVHTLRTAQYIFQHLQVYPAALSWKNRLTESPQGTQRSLLIEFFFTNFPTFKPDFPGNFGELRNYYEYIRNQRKILRIIILIIIKSDGNYCILR